MIAHGAREASGVNRILTTRSLISLRVMSSALGYLFLSVGSNSGFIEKIRQHPLVFLLPIERSIQVKCIEQVCFCSSSRYPHLHLIAGLDTPDF